MAKDVEHIQALMGRAVADRVFVLESEGRQYFIVAVGAFVQENDVDMFESSLFPPHGYPMPFAWRSLVTDE